jgi:hypothetical protein
VLCIVGVERGSPSRAATGHGIRCLDRAANALAASDPRFSAPVFVVDDLVVGGLVAGDFNRDGNQDLAVADYDFGSRFVWRG